MKLLALAGPTDMASAEQTLDQFFERWVFKYKVVAPVEGGLEFIEARRAWGTMRHMLNSYYEHIKILDRDLEHHRAKHNEWLTAYQNERCKTTSDYTRMFVRRPRMRRLVRILISL